MSNFVSINGTKLIDLMTVQRIEETDYLIVQKDTNGDQKTRKILWSDVKALIESEEPDIIQEESEDYQILISDDYVAGSGTITLTLPLLADAIKSVVLKNNGVGSITIDGNGSSVENGTTLSTTQARRFIPLAGGWAEVT